MVVGSVVDMVLGIVTLSMSVPPPFCPVEVVVSVVVISLVVVSMEVVGTVVMVVVDIDVVTMVVVGGLVVIIGTRHRMWDGHVTLHH